MRHRILVVLFLIYAVNYLDRQLLALLIEPIKQDIGMSDTAAGVLYGVTFTVFFSLLGIPIARQADRSNRSRIITASLVLFSLMTAATGWASAYWHLLLARIGVGIGEAGTGPPSQSVIADLYPLERRGVAMAVFTLGPHLGILLGFLVGGVIAQALGWRAVFLVAGGAGALMVAVAAFMLREPARAAPDAPAVRQIGVVEGVRILWRSPSMRHLFAGGTLATTAVTALLAWIAAFLMRAHGLSLSTTGALLAVVLGVLGALGTLFSGALADRMGARDQAWRLRTVAVGLLIAAPCWAIVIATDDPIAAFVALAIAGALIASYVGPSFAMVQSIAPPEMRALAASLLLFVANLIGVGLGPLSVGLLSDALFAQYGADSLGMGLMIAPPLLLWAAVHYELAARRLGADLRTAIPSHAFSR